MRDFTGHSTRAEGPTKDLTGHGTILLVEDDDGLRALMARGLRSRGFDVIEASNGREALKAFGPAIDFIVSDVVMPQMDGPTLLETIRGQRPKVLFISGYPADGMPFLTKPFTLGRLVVAVKETISPSWWPL
jgi:two-component system cell cycle sensor histidine kinase/response regulator CckA